MGHRRRGRNSIHTKGFGGFPRRECWHPKRQPFVASLYFMSFFIIGAFVVFSLFIGAITGGMDEALAEYQERSEAERLEKDSQSVDSVNP